MKAFFAIVSQTMRSAIRAKVFHVLAVFILLAVFLLPVTVSGDGTAKGLVQIAVTYSLGIVVALISTTTLWLSCSQLSREIETYNIHLVVSKPCPKWTLWLGKWTGIFVMHAVILLVSAALIYCLIQFRISHETAKGRFSKAEIEQLDKEIRVGRRSFNPVPPKYRELVEAEYQKKKANGEVDGENPDGVKAEIRRQMVAKDGEVKPGAIKTWVFHGVSTSKKHNALFLRYRIYSGTTYALDQRIMPCIWGLRVPNAGENVVDPFSYNLANVLGGTFQEVQIDPEFIDKSDDNSITLRFANPPPDTEFWRGAEAASVMFQPNDGPVILAPVSSFFENYCRAMVLALLQIAFLAALGCTVSAAFSTPVAAFVAVAYLVIGLMVQPAINAPLQNEDGSYDYKGIHDRAAHYLAICVGQLVVSVDDLDATSDLARGNLVENSRLARSLLTLLLLKTGLISGVGFWIIYKRELGAVIRR